MGIFDKKSIENFEIPTGQPFVITFIDGEITEYGYLSNIKFAGRKIIDSRGNPTVEVDVLHNNRFIVSESCPSGASTGTNRHVNYVMVNHDIVKRVLIKLLVILKFSDTEFLQETDIFD